MKKEIERISVLQEHPEGGFVWRDFQWPISFHIDNDILTIIYHDKDAVKHGEVFPKGSWKRVKFSLSTSGA